MTAPPSPTLLRARPAPAAGRPRSSQPRPVPRRLVGRYRYERRSGQWCWSPEMAVVLGLSPGAVPGTELLVRPQQPADRSRTLEAIAGACSEGRPFSLRLQLTREDGSECAVVLAGDPVPGAGGTVEAVEGVLLEIPDEPGRDDDADRVRALEAEVAQLRTAMSSRAAIEQAKGILMLLTGCGEQVAFELLAHISSNCHRKVRDVAVAVVDSAAGRAPLPPDVCALVRDVCPPAPRDS